MHFRKYRHKINILVKILSAKSIKMPEKSKSASFTLYYEQEKLAQLSEDTHDDEEYDELCSCDECCGEEEEEDIEGIGYDYDSGDDNYDDDNLPDLGEVLGFRITGGSDFFMPITIFHVIYLMR
jgi:hypothetical protein